MPEKEKGLLWKHQFRVSKIVSHQNVSRYLLGKVIKYTGLFLEFFTVK